MNARSLPGLKNRLVASFHFGLWRPEGPVGLHWFFRSPSLINRRFRRRSRITMEHQGEHLLVTINGELYVWPVGAPLHSLLDLVSELQNRHHPNQYLWGETQIHPGDVLIDIGACEGGFAARGAELGAKVIAVEPSRAMAEVMNRLFDLRELERPLVVPVLLGEEEGECHFIENRINPGKSKVVSTPRRGSYPVRKMTLDTLVQGQELERVDFIKCDAEGADVSILKGARDTLARFHPKLAVCTYHRASDYDELSGFLADFGYRVQGKGLLHSNGKLVVVMLHAWVEK